MKPAALLCALAVVSGCASFSFDAAENQPATLPDGHASAVLAFTHWHTAGRIGVQRQDEGFSGSLDWREREGEYELRVSAPLNGGTLGLSGGPQGVTLTAPDGSRHHARTAHALMQAQLGWALPLAGARYWVRGVPAPGSPVEQAYFDDAGRWTDFVQDGWRVSILDYLELESLSLPRKLFLSHGDLKVRVVLKQWEPLPP